FEDDDYSMQVRTAGYRVVVADDAYVHHFGQATIADPAVVDDFGALFHANRRCFEDKWGMQWEPGARRPSPEYHAVIERVRAIVAATVPPGERVLVVSKGDGALLELDGLAAEHFPQGDDGAYAGHHPATSAEAIDQLEALRE